ncbi:sensor domain-containing protein [Micromonospora endophytica]|uniref:sensor domain-containing protein n=1 Tax=Micromonospora endophytica TaxID=515350 RepID=UPI002017EA62|nr:sensor domain-containing protein [Micromonospora endophytica]
MARPGLPADERAAGRRTLARAARGAGTTVRRHKRRAAGAARVAAAHRVPDRWRVDRAGAGTAARRAGGGLRTVPARPGRRPAAAPTPWRGFVARYTTGAAWREAAYLFLLGTVVPAVYWLFILLVTLVLLLVASPFVVSPGEQVRVLWSTAETPGQAVPYAIVGVLLLPVLWTRSACSPPPRARWPGGCSARTAPR